MCIYVKWETIFDFVTPGWHIRVSLGPSRIRYWVFQVLVQYCCTSFANALELQQCCTDHSVHCVGVLAYSKVGSMLWNDKINIWIHHRCHFGMSMSQQWTLLWHGYPRVFHWLFCGNSARVLGHRTVLPILRLAEFQSLLSRYILELLVCSPVMEIMKIKGV